LYLDGILGRALLSLKVEEMLSKVLPDQPEMILRAASRLYPGQDTAPGRTVFLRAALTSFDRQPQPLSAAKLVAKGRGPLRLGLYVEADTSFREALSRDAGNVDARFELARLCYDRGQFSEALAEVRMVLLRQPQHGGAIALEAQLAQKG